MILRERVRLAGKCQAVEQEQPRFAALLLFDGKPEQAFAPGFGKIHGQQHSVGAGVGFDAKIVLRIGDQYPHDSLLVIGLGWSIEQRCGFR